MDTAESVSAECCGILVTDVVIIELLTGNKLLNHGIDQPKVWCLSSGVAQLYEKMGF